MGLRHVFVVNRSNGVAGILSESPPLGEASLLIRLPNSKLQHAICISPCCPAGRPPLQRSFSFRAHTHSTLCAKITAAVYRRRAQSVRHHPSTRPRFLGLKTSRFRMHFVSNKPVSFPAPSTKLLSGPPTCGFDERPHPPVTDSVQLGVRRRHLAHSMAPGGPGFWSGTHLQPLT
jgi:hypothetical protein